MQPLELKHIYIIDMMEAILETILINFICTRNGSKMCIKYLTPLFGTEKLSVGVRHGLSF